MNTKSLWLGWMLALGFAWSCPTARAQAPAAPEMDDVRMAINVLRSDFNADKIATLNRVLRLTAPEAEKFWPIYRRYEAELAAVGDRKLALIREFEQAHFGGTLDDRKARKLANDWLKNTRQRLDLWTKYHRRLSKALSPLRAAQFLQVEHQMALFVDLTIASEMPAVGSSR